MKKSDLVSSSFWLLFSSLVTVESYRFGLGNLHRPGPGFLPFAASLLLSCLSLLLLLQNISGREGMAVHSAARARFSKIASTVAALFLYLFLLEKLGFIVCTLLLIGFLLRVIEGKGWSVAFSTALIMTIFSYVLFALCLNIQLPSSSIMDVYR